MKTKLSLLFLLCTGLVCAQQVRITQHYMLDKVHSDAYYPVLSDDGKQILFTAENYEGLNLFDFVTEKTGKISAEPGAGYDPVFGNAGEKIYYRQTSFKQGRKFNSLFCYDRKQDRREILVEPVRSLKNVRIYEDGVTTLVNKSLMKKGVSHAVTMNIPLYVSTDEKKLLVYRNGVCQELQPVGDEVAGYIWASVSPDNRKILFYAAGKGAFVSDPEGNILAELGDVQAPVWYNNDFVVGMMPEDDGHVFTASRIVMVSVDGKFRQDLTEKNSMAMYPSVSEKAGRIVYNTLNGKIGVMDIKVTR